MRLLSTLRTRPLLRKVISATSWQLLDKLLRAVLGLAVGIWVARYLGTSGFGILNFAIAFVALFSFVADLGLQAIVVRDVVRRPELREEIVASALAVRLFGAAVAVALTVLAIRAFSAADAESRVVVLIIALSLVPQAWDVIDFDFQARMKARPVVIVRCASLAISSIARILSIAADAKLTTFAWIIVGEAALSAILLRVVFRVEFPFFTIRRASLEQARYLLRQSWPAALSGLAVILYMRIDQVMLGSMLGNHEVGIFAAAVRVSESWYFIPMAISAAVAPALTAAYGQSKMTFQRYFVACTRVLILISLVAAITFTAFGEQIVILLFGPAYEDAAIILAIHGWSGLFASLGVATGSWFVNAGMLTWRMVHTVIGACVNVGLNLLLIPRYGVSGAAIATLISYSVAAFWLNAVSTRTREVFGLQLRSLVFDSCFRRTS